MLTAAAVTLVLVVGYGLVCLLDPLPDCARTETVGGRPRRCRRCHGTGVRRRPGATFVRRLVLGWRYARDDTQPPVLPVAGWDDDDEEG